MADVEARQEEKTTKLVADLEARTTEIRRSLQLAADQQELDRGWQQRSEKQQLAQVSAGGDEKRDSPPESCS